MIFRVLSLLQGELSIPEKIMTAIVVFLFAAVVCGFFFYPPTWPVWATGMVAASALSVLVTGAGLPARLQRFRRPFLRTLSLLLYVGWCFLFLGALTYGAWQYRLWHILVVVCGSIAAPFVALLLLGIVLELRSRHQGAGGAT